MKTNWPDDRIDRELDTRNPLREDEIAGSERTPEAQALLSRLLAIDPVARQARDEPERSTPWHAASPSRRVRRRRVVFGGMTVAGLSAAVVVALLLPGSPARPQSAAAAVLHQAAEAAADQPATGELGPGQYLYSETSGTTGTGSFDVGKGGPIYVVYHETIQQWVAADGSGREVDTYAGPAQFATSASEQNWVAAGSPASVLSTPAGPDGGSVEMIYGPGCPDTGAVCSGTATDPNPGAVPFDVSTLPTNPAALLQVIEAGNIGSANLKDEGLTTGAPVWKTFLSCIGLLTVPENGVAPAFRAAVFQVMAGLPGVQLLGATTDASGQPGTGLLMPTGDGEGTRLVIDPGTGKLLEQETVITNPSAEPEGMREYFGATAGQVVGSTDYLSSGIVDSTTAVPSSSASSS